MGPKAPIEKAAVSRTPRIAVRVKSIHLGPPDNPVNFGPNFDDRSLAL